MRRARKTVFALVLRYNELGTDVRTSLSAGLLLASGENTVITAVNSVLHLVLTVQQGKCWSCSMINLTDRRTNIVAMQLSPATELIVLIVEGK